MFPVYKLGCASWPPGKKMFVASHLGTIAIATHVHISATYGCVFATRLCTNVTHVCRDTTHLCTNVALLTQGHRDLHKWCTLHQMPPSLYATATNLAWLWPNLAHVSPSSHKRDASLRECQPLHKSYTSLQNCHLMFAEMSPAFAHIPLFLQMPLVWTNAFLLRIGVTHLCTHVTLTYSHRGLHVTQISPSQMLAS